MKTVVLTVVILLSCISVQSSAAASTGDLCALFTNETRCNSVRVCQFSQQISKCVASAQLSCASFTTEATCGPVGICYWDMRRTVCVDAVVSQECSCAYSDTASTLQSCSQSADWTLPSSGASDRLFAVVEGSSFAPIPAASTLPGKYGCYTKKSSSCACTYDSINYSDRTYRMCSAGCNVIQISGFTGTRASGNGRYKKFPSELLLEVDVNCGTTAIYIQQTNGTTPAFIASNRNMVSANSMNVFWIVLSDINDITRLSTLTDINKVFSGQIIDQRGFPNFHAVVLDDASKSTFVPEALQSANTVFAGTDKISIKCACPLATITSISVVSSTELRVQWTYDTNEAYSSVEYSLAVDYKVISPCPGLPQPILSLSFETKTISLSGLNAGNRYQIVISILGAGNACVPSQSLPKTEKTLELAPDIPTYIQAIPINSTAILLQWDEPPCSVRNGDIIAYQATYSRLPNQPRADPRILGTIKTQSFANVSGALVMIVSGLEPAMQYRFQMQATTSVGNSSFSQPVIVQTNEAVPSGAPQNVVAQRSDDSKSILVKWSDPPLHLQHGVIYEYSVERQVVDAVAGQQADCSDKPFDFQTTRSLNITLTDIDPSLGYFVRVRARTLASSTFGPPSGCAKVSVPTAATAAASTSSSSSLIGGVVGGVVAAVLLVGLVVFLRIRRGFFGQTSISTINDMYGDVSKFTDELAHLEIERTNISLVRELGEGQFGKVLQASAIGLPGDAETVTTVAVKFLNTNSDASDRAIFAEEAVRMKVLDHPHVIKLLAVCFKTEPSCIIIEYMAKGDLKNFLRNCRATDEHPALLTPFIQLEMGRQVCEGLAYLHEKGYIHRDLAARNVLIDANDVLKIADFDKFFLFNGPYGRLLVSIFQVIWFADIFLSFCEQYYRKTGKGLLPLRWMSPESFLDGVFDVKSDVWMFGVCLWEIFSYANMPWPGIGDGDVMDGVKNGNKLERPSGVPLCCYDIMVACWNLDPESRPAAAQLAKMISALEESDLVPPPEDEPLERSDTESKFHAATSGAALVKTLENVATSSSATDDQPDTAMGQDQTPYEQSANAPGLPPNKPRTPWQAANESDDEDKEENVGSQKSADPRQTRSIVQAHNTSRTSADRLPMQPTYGQQKPQLRAQQPQQPVMYASVHASSLMPLSSSQTSFFPTGQFTTPGIPAAQPTITNPYHDDVFSKPALRAQQVPSTSVAQRLIPIRPSPGFVQPVYGSSAPHFLAGQSTVPSVTPALPTNMMNPHAQPYIATGLAPQLRSANPTYSQHPMMMFSAAPMQQNWVASNQYATCTCATGSCLLHHAR